VSLAWRQHLLDMKRQDPLRPILNMEIYQHQIMTRIWKYMTERHAPHVTPYNIGHIVYRHTPHSHIHHITNMCTDCLRNRRCLSRLQRHHCNPDKHRRPWVTHPHSTIFIKLRCGCIWKIGNSFYDVLKNMKIKVFCLTRHVHTCQNVHPR